jgi:hypothetical protein
MEGASFLTESARGYPDEKATRPSRSIPAKSSAKKISCTQENRESIINQPRIIIAIPVFVIALNKISSGRWHGFIERQPAPSESQIQNKSESTVQLVREAGTTMTLTNW